MAIQLSGTYTPTVPQGNQQINNTQQPINTNFQDISELISVNHIPFNTANTFGEHNYVTYYGQPNTPGASTNQMVIFSTVTDSGASLNYQYPNNSTVYTLGSTNPAGPTVDGNGAGSSSNIGGYQYLSGSLLMQFAIFYLTTTPTGNINYSGTQIFSWANIGNAASFTQTPFYIECSPAQIGTSGIGATSYCLSTGIIEVVAIDNLTFSVTVANTTNVAFYVMAIGI